MKNIALHIILLMFLTGSLKAQNDRDSLNSNFINKQIDILKLHRSEKPVNEKIYRIWFDDYQVLELVANEKYQIKGQFVNYVTKIARKEPKNKIVSQKLIIPEKTAQNLFEKFHQENIETLPDYRYIDNYVIGCDGNSVTFEIKTPNIQRSYFYWEPEFQVYQDSTNINVIAVRQTLIALNKEINRSQLFKNFTETLGIGKYRYGMIIMTKK